MIKELCELLTKNNTLLELKIDIEDDSIEGQGFDCDELIDAILTSIAHNYNMKHLEITCDSSIKSPEVISKSLDLIHACTGLEIYLPTSHPLLSSSRPIRKISAI